MKRIENDCCNCDRPCPPGGCYLKHNPHWYCDCCGRDYRPEQLYNVDGDMICEECAAENFSIGSLMEALYGTVCE